MVGPRLQRRANGEVIHRCAKHKHVSCQQLVHQLVGYFDGFSLRGRTLLDRGKERTHHLFCQVRHRICRQVTRNDEIGRILVTLGGYVVRQALATGAEYDDGRSLLGPHKSR